MDNDFGARADEGLTFVLLLCIGGALESLARAFLYIMVMAGRDERNKTCP